MGSKRAEKARALDGEKVQALRLRLDLSLGALAAKADCAPRTVVNAEKGKPILFGVIRDLAEALEVENSDLMPGGPTVEEIIARKRTVKPGGVGESLLHERKPFLSQLGPDAADFVGREDEIAKMVNILCDGALRPRVCTIRGMGGVGKTTLALRVAHLVKTSYPDGQLMIELQGMSPEPTTVVAAMTQVVRAFGWDVESLPRDEAGMLPIYRNTMAGKRALLVLDNARDESQVRQLASLAAPAGVIVTSRSLLALDAAVDVGVEVLSPEQSFSLLHAITKDKGSESELRVVVDLCGQLPLALRVAGDFLRLHVNWTVTRYISALADEGRRLGHLKGRSENRDVEAVLALSARQLAVEDEPLAVRWEMLSAFRGPVNPEMAAVMWGLGPMSAPDADGGLDQLTELLDRSLLLHLGDDEYTYHDLMRPVALGVFGYVEGHRMQVGTGVRQEIARRRAVWAPLYKPMCNLAELAAAQVEVDSLLRTKNLRAEEMIHTVRSRLKGKAPQQTISMITIILSGEDLKIKQMAGSRSSSSTASKSLEQAAVCDSHVCQGYQLLAGQKLVEAVTEFELAAKAAEEISYQQLSFIARMALGRIHAAWDWKKSVVDYFEPVLEEARAASNQEAEADALMWLAQSPSGLISLPPREYALMALSIFTDLNNIGGQNEAQELLNNLK